MLSFIYIAYFIALVITLAFNLVAKHAPKLN